MYNPFTVFTIFWIIRTSKHVLFWIYLWQLKEYHTRRFIDHFRTHKGKKIFLNYLFASKFLLFLLVFLNYQLAFYLLLLVYVMESLLFLINVAMKSVKRPKLTVKTLLLTLVSFSIVGLYALWAGTYLELLLFDIFVPLIISLVILLIQPLFVGMRNAVILKAKSKIKKYKNLKVIGITGSYGKTSTKEFLVAILSKKYHVLATPEHKNSEIGIADTILASLNDAHQVFVVEMGAYQKGGIRLLCDIVNPAIGVVTGINEQHLATFGSLEDLLSAEGGQELAAHLGNKGLLVVNGDNAYCLDLYQNFLGNKKVYTAKKDKVDSDIWAEEIEIQKESVSFIVRSRQGEMAYIGANVLGGQNAQNLLGAILVARELGMSFGAISGACRNIMPTQAGMTLKVGVHGLNIIDSSYSSNPDGVIADLEYLKVFEGRRVIVMPCLIELGKESINIHHRIGKKIAEICDLAIITTRDRFEELKSGFLSADKSNKKPQLVFSENPKEIFTMITTFCAASDVILLEGGRPKELIKLLLNRSVLQQI